MRFFLELSFNGNKYHGWQIQPNVITVQSEINRVLSVILGSSIHVTGAGRTDTGVHAIQMFAHFDFEYTISTEMVINKMNMMLSNDILIKQLFLVNNNFHSRFDAISRTYEYHISHIKNPFNKNVFFIQNKLNISSMNFACKKLLGKKDFSSFSKSKTQTYTNDCEIFYANWTKTNFGCLFTIKADRFLRNMVRAIVGTLINVGNGKINNEQFSDIIQKKDRSYAGFSVPANALFLVSIDYSSEKEINAKK